MKRRMEPFGADMGRAVPFMMARMPSFRAAPLCSGLGKQPMRDVAPVWGFREASRQNVAVLELLATQQADGSFRWDSSLDRWLDDAGMAQGGLRSAITSLLSQAAIGREVHDLQPLVDTLLVMHLLRSRHGGDSRIWIRAYRKAAVYVSGETGWSEEETGFHLKNLASDAGMTKE